jgi:hypothetical protein
MKTGGMELNNIGMTEGTGLFGILHPAVSQVRLRGLHVASMALCAAQRSMQRVGEVCLDEEIEKLRPAWSNGAPSPFIRRFQALVLLLEKSHQFTCVCMTHQAAVVLISGLFFLRGILGKEEKNPSNNEGDSEQPFSSHNFPTISKI